MYVHLFLHLLLFLCSRSSTLTMLARQRRLKTLAQVVVNVVSVELRVQLFAHWVCGRSVPGSARRTRRLDLLVTLRKTTHGYL